MAGPMFRNLPYVFNVFFWWSGGGRVSSHMGNYDNLEPEPEQDLEFPKKIQQFLSWSFGFCSFPWSKMAAASPYIHENQRGFQVGL